MKTPSQRNRDLAQIHMAAAALRMDDQARRDKMQAMFGKTSAADLTTAERGRLLVEFERLGWKPSKPGKHTTYKQAQSRCMIMLWKDLHKAGRVADKTNRAFEAWVNGQSGKLTPDFLTPAEAANLIERLRQWLNRGD